jgi:hypothetical protein
MSPNFSHLIAVVFWVVEAYEDCRHRPHLPPPSWYYFAMPRRKPYWRRQAGRKKSVRIWTDDGFCVFHVQPVQVMTRPEWLGRNEGVAQGIHWVAGSTFGCERWAGRRGMLAFILHSRQGNRLTCLSILHLQNDACIKPPAKFLLEKWQAIGVIASKQIDTKEQR